jgi:hypothetical protein
VLGVKILETIGLKLTIGQGDSGDAKKNKKGFKRVE